MPTQQETSPLTENAPKQGQGPIRRTRGLPLLLAICVASLVTLIVVIAMGIRRGVFP